jgi:hypothetical protein
MTTTTITHLADKIAATVLPGPDNVLSRVMLVGLLLEFAREIKPPVTTVYDR